MGAMRVRGLRIWPGFIASLFDIVVLDLLAIDLLLVLVHVHLILDLIIFLPIFRLIFSRRVFALNFLHRLRRFNTSFENWGGRFILKVGGGELTHRRRHCI